MKNNVEVKNISFSYGKTEILKDLSLDIREGEFMVLLGPSGCGKTTLLNIISGLINPTKGDILFDDKMVSNLNPVERNIAQIFQFPVIYDTMTVYDNLAFPLKIWLRPY